MNSNQNQKITKLKICSACLVGIKCKWDGKSKPTLKLIEMLKKGNLLPLCPEQLGGLTTPRPPCGILHGTGVDVIEGKADVIDKKMRVYTKQFIKGAEEVLRLAKNFSIDEAILKSTSPCCSSGGKVWQISKQETGKYVNKLVPGDGVLTALLKKNGIGVKSEKDI
jgi:uncharacterized protein YbbK (DUF523 family)